MIHEDDWRRTQVKPYTCRVCASAHMKLLGGDERPPDEVFRDCVVCGQERPMAYGATTARTWVDAAKL